MRSYHNAENMLRQFRAAGIDPRAYPRVELSSSNLVSRVSQDGELVSFSEVVGMDKLNTHGPFKVKNCKVRCGIA